MFVGWLATGCSHTPANATPDGTVRQFVERMSRFDGNERDGAALFAMLSERAKNNLRGRAERYSAASGRKIAPSAMLVPAHMSPRFVPQNYSAQVAGKYAMVEITGSSPGQSAQVPCVYEQGAWRLEIVLPELPPLRTRAGHEP